MRRVASALRALGARAPWVIAFAAAAWGGPRLLRRAVGLPEARLFLGDPQAAVFVGIVATAVLAALATTFVPTRAEGPSRWRRALAVPAVGLSGIAALVSLIAPHVREWRWALWEVAHDVLESPYMMVVGLTALAFVDTLRRPNLSADDLTLRAGSAATALWLAGTWSHATATLSSGCDAATMSAEYAAWSVTGGYRFRLFAELSATGGLMAVLCFARRRLPGGPLLPLASLLLWMAGRSASDLVTYAAAGAITVRGVPPADAVDSLARVAGVLGAVGLAFALVAWITSACGAEPRRRSWRALWPILPILLATTSPAFEPPLYLGFPQQMPEAVWEEAGVEPLTWPGGRGRVPFFRTRDANVISGVLAADGTLTLYRDGRGGAAGSLVDVPRYHHGAGVRIELVVDRETTLGALRRAAQRLRLAEGIGLVWRHNELHRTSDATRQRWGFVELASRALRACDIELLAKPTSCDERHQGEGTRALRRCVQPGHEWMPDEVYLIEAPDDLKVADWLKAHAGAERRLALATSTHRWPTENATGLYGRRRPRRALERRVALPDLAGGLGGGVLLGLLLGLRRRARDSRLGSRPYTGGPYRTPVTRPAPRGWRVAALREAARGVSRACATAASRWIVLSALAMALGLALPGWLAG